MKIKFKSLTLIIMICIILSGCNLPWKSNNTDDDNYFMTGSYSDSKEDEPNKPAYKWLVKPKIKAGNVISFDASQINTDEDNNKSYMKFSILYDNGKYGFIDYNGDIVIKPKYEQYYFCHCGDMVLYNVVDRESKQYEICSIDKSGNVTHDIKKHENTVAKYYWNTNDKKIYVKKENETFATEYSGKEAVIAAKTEVTQINSKLYSVPSQSDNLYGYLKDGKKILDFEYENFYAPAFKSAKKTAIALKKNGKWGYVASDGDEIIPFQCDGILSSYSGTLMDSADDLHPYLFSEGFIPVCINSNYCYYDIEGNCVVPLGEFEQARPVNNGKAWVRYNGCWGVIQLGEIADEENNDSADESQVSTKKHSTTYPKHSKTKTNTTKISKKNTTTKYTTKKTNAKTTKLSTRATTHKTTQNTPQQTQSTTLPPETTTSATTLPPPPVTDPPQTSTEKEDE